MALGAAPSFSPFSPLGTHCRGEKKKNMWNVFFGAKELVQKLLAKKTIHSRFFINHWKQKRIQILSPTFTSFFFFFIFFVRVARSPVAVVGSHAYSQRSSCGSGRVAGLSFLSCKSGKSWTIYPHVRTSANFFRQAVAARELGRCDACYVDDSGKNCRSNSPAQEFERPGHQPPGHCFW